MVVHVFICHSSKTPEEARVRAEVVKLLGESPGVYVLGDRERLRAGDQWHGKIGDWMETAHAAVVLLGPSALKSEFVTGVELPILATRRQRTGSFELVPILIDGVTPEQARQDPTIQRLRLSDLHFGSTPADLRPMIERIFARHGRRAYTPSEILFDNLRTAAIGLQLGPNLEAITELLADARHAEDTRSVEDRFVSELLAASTDRALAAVEEIRLRLLERGAELERRRAHALDILDLSIAGWLDRAHVDAVEKLIEGPAEQRCVFIDGEPAGDPEHGRGAGARLAPDRWVAGSLLARIARQRVGLADRPLNRDVIWSGSENGDDLATKIAEAVLGAAKFKLFQKQKPGGGVLKAVEHLADRGPVFLTFVDPDGTAHPPEVETTIRSWFRDAIFARLRRASAGARTADQMWVAPPRDDTEKTWTDYVTARVDLLEAGKF